MQTELYYTYIYSIRFVYSTIVSSLVFIFMKKQNKIQNIKRIKIRKQHTMEHFNLLQ